MNRNPAIDGSSGADWRQGSLQAARSARESQRFFIGDPRRIPALVYAGANVGAVIDAAAILPTGCGHSAPLSASPGVGGSPAGDFRDRQRRMVECGSSGFSS